AEMSALLLPFVKVRLQRLAHARIQRRPELFADRGLVQRHGFPEAPRYEQSDRPVVEATEEIDVTNEELAEVHWHAPVHEVQEHEPARIVLLDADGQLV